MPGGKEFHNLGAAIVNEQSPSVRYDLPTGVLSKSSLVDRKLYLVRNNFYILLTVI